MLLEYGHHSTAIGVVDVITDGVGLQSLDQCLDGFVLLVSFLDSDHVHISGSSIAVFGFHGQSVSDLQTSIDGIVAVDDSQVNVLQTGGDLSGFQLQDFQVLLCFP